MIELENVSMTYPGAVSYTHLDVYKRQVRSIINSHPEFISLSGGYTYWTSGSSITKIAFTYLTNANH